jgi:hypothetical protein
VGGALFENILNVVIAHSANDLVRDALANTLQRNVEYREVPQVFGSIEMVGFAFALPKISDVDAVKSRLSMTGRGKQQHQYRGGANRRHSHCGSSLQRDYLFFDLVVFGDLRFACARSEPATDLTVSLLLVRRSWDALLASLFEVAIFSSIGRCN